MTEQTPFACDCGILVRPATPNDRDAIRRVVIDAFSASEFGYGGEAEIVEQLHGHCDDLVSLVATEDVRIVGQILFSPVTIETRHTVTHGMGLAPMAVAPARQRTGIGTALVEAGLRRLAQAGCRFVVVLGHPQFYERFGFQPAKEHGITHGFEGIPQDAFLINVLGATAEESIVDGRATYRPEFGPQHQQSR